MDKHLPLSVGPMAPDASYTHFRHVDDVALRTGALVIQWRESKNYKCGSYNFSV